MRNIFFQDETVTQNDLYFLCYMIERISRKIHQQNKIFFTSCRDKI